LVVFIVTPLWSLEMLGSFLFCSTLKLCRNTFVFSVVMKPGACRGLVIPGASTYLYMPYEILLWRNVRITGTANLPAQNITTCKRISPQKRHLKWEYEIKKAVRV